MNQLNSLRNITLPSRHLTNIEDVKFDEVEVYAALCRINPSKSCAPDNIPVKILVESALEIHKPLTKIFDMSIRTGELPKDWTKTPIHKKGPRHQPSNYRPISLTSLAVKLMERVIYSLRCRISFALLRSSIRCIRCIRSHRGAAARPVPPDLVRAETGLSATY